MEETIICQVDAQWSNVDEGSYAIVPGYYTTGDDGTPEWNPRHNMMFRVEGNHKVPEQYRLTGAFNVADCVDETLRDKLKEDIAFMRIQAAPGILFDQMLVEVDPNWMSSNLGDSEAH